MFEEDRVDIAVCGGIGFIGLFILLIIGTVFLFRSCDLQPTSAAEIALTGKAAWYSKIDPTDPFKHKFNADGSRFDENALTCAMRSRDFGKYYKVINLRNGQSVVVKHADFGPALTYKGKKLNRLIDLSKAAFAAIADLDTGIITVRVEEFDGETRPTKK